MKNIFKKAVNKVSGFAVRAIIAVGNRKAEGYVDTGVKILIAVVVGALLLSGLYSLFGDTILPILEDKITGLFNYAG